MSSTTNTFGKLHPPYSGPHVVKCFSHFFGLVILSLQRCKNVVSGFSRKYLRILSLFLMVKFGGKDSSYDTEVAPLHILYSLHFFCSGPCFLLLASHLAVSFPVISHLSKLPKKQAVNRDLTNFPQIRGKYKRN